MLQGMGGYDTLGTKLLLPSQNTPLGFFHYRPISSLSKIKEIRLVWQPMKPRSIYYLRVRHALFQVARGS